MIYLYPFHDLQIRDELKVKLCHPMAPPTDLEPVASHQYALAYLLRSQLESTPSHQGNNWYHLQLIDRQANAIIDSRPASSQQSQAMSALMASNRRFWSSKLNIYMFIPRKS